LIGRDDSGRDEAGQDDQGSDLTATTNDAECDGWGCKFATFESLRAGV